MENSYYAIQMTTAKYNRPTGHVDGSRRKVVAGGYFTVAKFNVYPKISILI